MVAHTCKDMGRIQKAILAIYKDRKQLGAMTQKRLARRIGCSQSMVSELLSGDKRLSDDWIEKICDALGVSLGDLEEPKLGGGDPRELREFSFKLQRLRSADDLPAFRSVTRTINEWLRVVEKAETWKEGAAGRQAPHTAGQADGLPEEADDLDEPREPVYAMAPIYGGIVMGDPEDTDQQPVDHIPIVHSQVRKGQYILRARGDSMSPVFEPGDLLLIDNTLQAKPGDYVAAMLNRRTTLKQLLKDRKERLVLHPLNPKHKDRIVQEGNELTIQGVVLEIVRRRITR